MQASIAFVIPVLNEEAVIAGLLRDLRVRYPGSELIVVDGGSRDRSVARALPLCDQLLLCEPGRSRQMNLGARVASSTYIFFLHADSRPGVCWTALQACLRQRPLWGFCRIQLSGAQTHFRVIEWFMNQRSRITHIATGDQMLFVPNPARGRVAGMDS